MEYKIIPVRSYFEVYINGNFYCTADNESEAMEEVREAEREMVSV